MVAAACGVPTAANRHRDQVYQSHSKEEKLQHKQVVALTTSRMP